MGADDAVERRGDIGIAEIDGGDLGVDLGLLQVGLGVVARRGGLIESGLRDRLPRDQIRLALVVGLGLFQRRLGAGFRRLRLLELEPVGLGLDREQRGAFLHEGTVLIVDRLQHPLHPCHQIDRLDRRGIAGRLQIAGNGALLGECDIDRRRWRRHERVLLAAGQEHEGQERDGGVEGTVRRGAAVATQFRGDRLTRRLHPLAPIFLVTQANPATGTHNTIHPLWNPKANPRAHRHDLVREPIRMNLFCGLTILDENETN